MSDRIRAGLGVDNYIALEWDDRPPCVYCSRPACAVNGHGMWMCYGHVMLWFKLIMGPAPDFAPSHMSTEERDAFMAYVTGEPKARQPLLPAPGGSR